ncbi:MAG: LemA family protein [Coprobacter sp.]|nr:LemA family protein [Coprobacter sp.]
MNAVYLIVTVAVMLAIGMAAWGIFTSNSLIYKRNRIRQCRSGIGIVIKQRNDLIPNLVGAVKAYMGHESDLLARITEIRARALHQSENENMESGAEISSLLSRLNIAAENYPELKADNQFLTLQHQITEMERELQAVRRTYNAAVADYNNAIAMFPSSVIASWGKHTPEKEIVIPESEMHGINVSELFKK